MSAEQAAAQVPTFAVVGHPNKGKSSIVATLAEDAQIPVSPVPGTTTRTRTFTVSLSGRPLYRLADTPGFQRPRAVLAWLEAQAATAKDRSAAVAAFVTAHRDDPRFHDECELLTPLLEGAGILYVVDGSRPYGPEYEAEMEVLRWTGQPRMALVNPITGGDHVAEWQRALDQYFGMVRVFNAVHADFQRRVDLLRAFGALREDWRQPLDAAADALEAERARRGAAAARILADLLGDALGHEERRDLGDREATDADRQALDAAFQDWLRQRERRAWTALQAAWQHQGLDVAASGELLATDLFDREAWQVFGLSRQQLLAGGAMAGAATGALADAAVAGLSLFAGSALGAVLGAAGAWYGADNLAKVQVLGTSLGGRQLTMGPVRDPQFPWVLLGRGLLLNRLLAERNHARREALALDARSGEHLAGELPASTRRALNDLLAKLRKAPGDEHLRAAVAAELARDPATNLTAAEDST